jgi:hypothetical protein
MIQQLSNTGAFINFPVNLYPLDNPVVVNAATFWFVKCNLILGLGFVKADHSIQGSTQSHGELH